MIRRIKKNRTNLVTLLTYRKRTETEEEIDTIDLIIDRFSRDMNILGLLKELIIDNPESKLLDCLMVDLEKE